MVFGFVDHLLRAPPLANAGAAGIGQHRAANVFERCHLPIPLDGGANLLRAGVTMNGTAASTPCACACSATSAARLMSS